MKNTILLYVDPGSGSYLVQMIIAGILAAIFYIKSIWWRIKSFFSGRRPPDSSKDDLHD